MTPFQQDQPFEQFIALETDRTDRQLLQSLTTEVMQWSDSIWIMNLSPYYAYWHQQSRRKGSNPVGLWRQLFSHLLGESLDQDQSKVINLSPAYRACCARNPWSAVLLLTAMKERGVNGFISQNSKFGNSIFREFTWNTWWQATEASEQLFQKAKIKGFKPAGFKQQCKRLKMAIPRLGFKNPWEMKILNYNGVKKRFGQTLANIWNWTYGPHSSQLPVYQSGFPWKAWKFGKPPVVSRHLDYPLLVWEQFVPLLIEDLDKLCQTRRNSGERITRIDWELGFDDMQQLQIPIRFRNPHNLYQELGDHHTTLAQANFGFIELMNQYFPHTPGESSTTPPPNVIHWKLKLSSSLYLPDIMLDIFGESQEKDQELTILLKLENELPVDLKRYMTNNDWLPEDSYFEEHFDAEEIPSSEAEINRSLEAVAEDRPLYIRRSPLPIQAQQDLCEREFLESTMTKWWQRPKCPGNERHYFKYIDPEGCAVWVFQDTAGNWYQHGVFG